MATYKVAGVGEHGKFFDGNSYQDAINYICNPQKAAFVGGCNVTSADTAAMEMQKTAVAFGKDKGKRVRHSIISFDQREHVTPAQANDYARKIIQHYAPEYETVYAVHDNTDEVHIHLIMNQISYIDGHRYGGKKKDYYDFQRHIQRVTHLPVIPVK